MDVELYLFGWSHCLLTIVHYCSYRTSFFVCISSNNVFLGVHITGLSKSSLNIWFFFVLARSQVIYYVLNIGVFHPYQHVKHYNIDYAARRNIECF